MIPVSSELLEVALVRMRSDPTRTNERFVCDAIDAFADIFRAEGFSATEMIVALKHHIARVGDTASSATQYPEARSTMDARSARLITHAIRHYYREVPRHGTDSDGQAQQNCLLAAGH